MLKACATGDHCINLWLLYEMLFLFSKLAASPAFGVQKDDHGFVQYLVCNVCGISKKTKADVPSCCSRKTYFPCFLIQPMTLTCGWKGYTWHPAFSRSDLILDQNILSNETLQDTLHDVSVRFVYWNGKSQHYMSKMKDEYQQWHSNSIHLSMQAHRS